MELVAKVRLTVLDVVVRLVVWGSPAWPAVAGLVVQAVVVGLIVLVAVVALVEQELSLRAVQWIAVACHEKL